MQHGNADAADVLIRIEHFMVLATKGWYWIFITKFFFVIFLKHVVSLTTVTGLPMVNNVALAITFLIKVLLTKSKSDTESTETVDDPTHAHNFDKLVALCRKKLAAIVNTRYFTASILSSAIQHLLFLAFVLLFAGTPSFKLLCFLRSSVTCRHCCGLCLATWRQQWRRMTSKFSRK